MKLILVCGLPGSGKTTVANKIAEKTESLLFSTDVVRKEMVDKPVYDEKEKEMVYNLIFGMAEKFLKNAKNVVIDGTFYRKDLRKRIRDTAKKMKSDFHIVHVVCEESLIRERMGKRKGEETTSDADYKVYLKIKGKFEPIREKHFILKSGENENGQIEKFLKTI